MLQKITYIANDGEEFETEEECQAYELALNDCPGVLGFDLDLTFQDPEKLGANDAFVNSNYFYVYDAEQAEKTFEILGDYTGTTTPDGELHAGDLFRYDEENDGWVDMIAEYRKQTQTIGSLLNSIWLLRGFQNEALLKVFDEATQAFK